MERLKGSWLVSLAVVLVACSEEHRPRDFVDASDPVVEFDGSADGQDADGGAGEEDEDASLDESDAAPASDGSTETDAETPTDAAPSTDAASSTDAAPMDQDASSADAGSAGDIDAAAEAGSESDAALETDAQIGGGAADAGEDAGAPLDGGNGGLDAMTGDSGDADGSEGCESAGLSLPPGFCATVFADGLPSPRHLAVTPAGDVYVANGPRTPAAGPSFVALRDETGDGRADTRASVGDKSGNGIAWADGYLYFAANDSVVRYTLPSGTLLPSGDPTVLVRDLPATPDHAAKTVVVDGHHLYVNIGSASNSCQLENRALESPGVDPCPELERRSGVWKFYVDVPDQTQDGATRFATGTRNANALALHPRAGLFTAQNSRDQLHENWPQLFTPEDDARLPAEGIFQLNLGDDYGWPYCYYDAEAGKYFLAPEYGGDGEIEGRCAALRQPLSTLPAHWAPLGMVFYEGSQFPAHYRGGAFIANHGSRFAPDAAEPLPGYNVVFVPFSADGSSAGEYERFAEGFAGPARPLPDNALHRPVGVAVGPDGSLYVSDDKGGVIYKIVYRGR